MYKDKSQMEMYRKSVQNNYQIKIEFYDDM